MTLSISSTAFASGAAIPSRFTCEGDDISPPLSITGVPLATKSLVLIVDDPDALFAEFRTSGALHATAALRNTPWHTREFAVHDPNGHGLTFYRPL